MVGGGGDGGGDRGGGVHRVGLVFEGAPAFAVQLPESVRAAVGRGRGGMEVLTAANGGLHLIIRRSRLQHQHLICQLLPTQVTHSTGCTQHRLHTAQVTHSTGYTQHRLHTAQAIHSTGYTQHRLYTVQVAHSTGNTQ